MKSLAAEFGNFAPVVEYCREREIVLDENILESARLQRPMRGNVRGEYVNVDPTAYTPTASHAVFAYAANRFREQPNAEPLLQDVLSPDVADDMATLHTINLLNTDMFRTAGSGTDFTSDSIYRLDSCAWADRHFAERFATTPNNTGGTTGELESGNFGTQLIVDENDQPLFARKVETIPSALSLQPFRLNGRAYPAGTLVWLRLSEEPKIDSEDDLLVGSQLPDSRLVVREVRDVEEVGVMRMSIYASPPHERTDIIPAKVFGDAERATTSAKTDLIEAIRRRAALLAGHVCEREASLNIG